MLLMLLILFHFPFLGRQADKREGLKKLGNSSVGILLSRWTRLRGTIRSPSENSECDDDGPRRNIPRGIRRRGKYLCSPIVISQSSTNSLPVGKLLPSHP